MWKDTDQMLASMCSSRAWITVLSIYSLIVCLYANERRAGGVSLPNFSIRPPLLDRGKSPAIGAYACEGKPLHMSCENDQRIHLIRANYGRFSISICNDRGTLDWSVNCMSFRSFLIMQDRCSLKSSCSVVVSSSLFGDPCPGTLKYLEVQYQCVANFTTNNLRRPPHVNIPTILSVTNAMSPVTSATLPSQAKGNPSVTSAIPSLSTLTEAPSVTSHSATSATVISTNGGAVTEIHSASPTSSSAIWRTTAESTLRTTTTTTTVPVSRTSSPPKESSMPDFGKDYCQPVYVRNLLWNWTRAGHNAIHKCPGGATGLVKWYCAKDPVRWDPETPDFKECRSLWIDSLEERINTGDSVISIATDMALMTQAKSLYSEDLKHLTRVIKETLSRVITNMENFLEMWHRHQVLKELLQSIVETVSNLLNDTGANAWQDLSDTDRKHITSTLLDGLEESALLLADASNQESSLTVAKNNVLVSVQVLATRLPGSIRFPSSEDLQGTSWIRMEDSLLLPSNVLLENSKQGLAKAVFLAYNGVEDLLRPLHKMGSASVASAEAFSQNVSHIINSKVIGASFGSKKQQRLSHPVIIVLRHIQVENVSNPRCVFWNSETGDWSEEGCWIVSSNHTHTVCNCNHLTNFALLMEKSPLLSYHRSQQLYLIYSVGCVIAILCFIVTGLTLQFIRSCRSDRVSIHKNLCLCLVVSEIVFVGGAEQTYARILCGIVAGILHYFLLAAFAWMFLEGFQLYVMLIDVFENQKSRAGWYYALAYGAPALIVAVSAIVDPQSYGTEVYCWLRVDNYFCFSFVGPAVGILFGGIVFLCIAICITCHHPGVVTAVKGKEEAQLVIIRTGIRCALALLCLLTLTWTAGFLFLYQRTDFLVYTFAILNVSQGIFILVFYCLRNKKVQEDFCKSWNAITWMPSCVRRNKPPEPSAPHLPGASSIPSAPPGTLAGQHPNSNLQPQLRSSFRDSNSCTTLGFITQDPLSTTLPTSQECDEGVGVAVPTVTTTGTTLPRTRGAQSLQRSTRSSSSRRSSERRTSRSDEQRQADAQGWPKHHQRHLRQPQRASREHRHSPYFRFPNGATVLYGGACADHIYECIDDESATSSSDYHHSGGSMQTTTADSCYGEHSDWSQHSSSSYGYDQRPLLVANFAGNPMANTLGHFRHGASRDLNGPAADTLGGVRQHQTLQPQPRNRSGRGSRRRHSNNTEESTPFSVVVVGRAPRTRAPAATNCAMDAEDAVEQAATRTSASSQMERDSGSWSPVLPDLLQYPSDNALVMAVLDGEKVVNRIQPECHVPQTKDQKLSTYC